MVLAQSPAGPIEQVPNLKKRQRALYWRPMTVKGETQWIQTLPLPADPISRDIYFAKGFRLSPPPEGEAPQMVDTEKEALLAENARLKAMLQERKRPGRHKKVGPPASLE